MNQSLVTFARALVLLVLAWMIESWFVPILALFGMNESQIQEITSVVQWGLYAGAGLLLLLSLWRSRRSQDAEPPKLPELGGFDGMPEDGSEDEMSTLTGDEESLEGRDGGRSERGWVADESHHGNDYKNKNQDEDRDQDGDQRAALNELPAVPPDFIGRKSEINDLLKRMGQGKVKMLCLQSAEAGVGKTALALKLATRLQSGYPDAQLFLDMRGSSEQALSAAEAMSYVIRKFHPAAKLPQDERSLRASYRSVLKRKRVLLLLDDVVGREQIESLIPPASCALLMTSRQLFTMPDLTAKRLGPLTPDDGRTLLLNIAPRIGQHAGELATLCGLLPLALRLSASTLAHRLDMRPEEYVWQLRDPQSPISRLSGVEKILHLSYNLLDETQQGLWRMLAIFPSTFNQVAAAAVWQQDQEQSQRTLKALTALSLLEASPPLPKSEAEQEPESGSPSAAINEMAEDVAENVGATPPRGKPPEDVGAQDVGAQDVGAQDVGAQDVGAQDVAAQDVNSSLPRSHPAASEEVQDSRRYRLHKQAALFAEARLSEEERVAGVRRHAKHFDRVLRRASQLYEQASSQAEGQALFEQEWPNIQTGQVWAIKQLMKDNPEQQDKMAIALCSTYPEAGGSLLQRNLQPQEHIRWLEAALLASRKLEQPIGESTYLGRLGQAYATLGNFPRAIDLYEEQLKITRKIDDRHGEGNALNNMGDAYMQLGDMRYAIACYEQQLMITRDLKDQERANQILGNLGNAYTELGQTQDAIACYDQQLTLSRKMGDLQAQSEALGHLGHVYSEANQLHSALNYYERQLELVCDLGDQASEGKVFGKLGNLYADLGDQSHAITCYKEQLAIARQVGNRKEEGSALGNLGITYVETGQMRKATRYSEQALQIDRELGDKQNEAIGAWNLGLIYEQLGQFKRAYELLQITVQYKYAIGDPEAEAYAHRLETVREKLGRARRI